jgi:peptidoglycan/LPS O-acetylase OafA/YrhL
MSSEVFNAPENREAKQHRRDIDGLRAVAVLAVLAYHCNLQGLSGGFVGVDVFFVISGYLICALIVRDLDRGTFSIARFYERRCKRILPALFAILLFCLIAAMLICSPFEARQIGQSLMAVTLSVSNALFYRQGNYFNGGGKLNPLLMTWSLAVEEQFYIVFPLLMLLLYKQNKQRLLAILAGLCALSLLISIYMEFRHPEFNFYSPFTRAWEIGAGTLLALFEARRPIQMRSPWQEDILSWSGLALILSCIVFYSPIMRFPGFEAIPPVLGTVLVLAARKGGANRLLALPPLVAIGLISYSLYLWHWPLLSFTAMISPGPTSPRNRAILMVTAVVAATVSYVFIERPFRTRASPHVSRLLLAYISCTSCFLLFGAIIYFTGGIPQRSPELAAIERSLSVDRPHPCITMHASKPNLDPRCVPSASSIPAIALLGDSHAEALQPAIEKYAKANGFHLLVLTMPACPPLRGVTRYSADSAQFASECARFNEEALKIVVSRRDVKLVLLTGSWPIVTEDLFLPVNYSGNPLVTSAGQHVEYLLQGIRAEIDALELAGKKVVVVEDNPSLTFNPLARYRGAKLPIRHRIINLLGYPVTNDSATAVSRSETITPGAEKARTEMLSLIKSDPNLTVIDTKSLFCSSKECAVSDGKNLYYIDNNHISGVAEEKIVSRIESVQLAERPTAGTMSNTALRPTPASP